MKKGNLLYLWLIIIIFILLRIPYFQNITAVMPGVIYFFNSEWTFVGIYPWVLFFGLLEGALIVLYLRSLLDDLRTQNPQKFDL